MNTYTLPNGLRIIHEPSESPVVYCGYAIMAGTRNEAADEEGLAHFCEHTTFKGTQRRTALQIINRLETVGGMMNAYTTKDSTTYYASVLNQHLDRAVELLTDLVFRSTYPQTELDKEREVICDEIESYNDSPSELIFDEFENRLYQGTSLGHSILGTRESVHRFNSEDALQFARQHYRPDNAVFFASGELDFKRLVARIEKETRETCSPEGSRNLEALGELRTLGTLPTTQDRNLHQAHVMMGCTLFPGRDPRYRTLQLLNNILGGPGMNSRLNLALRERRGLVYTVESMSTLYTDTGWWGIYFGCDHEHVNRCLHLCQKEIEHLRTTPLTARQLQTAKTQLKGQMGIGADNRENAALDMGKTWLLYHESFTLEKAYEQIDSITATDLQQLAQEFLTPERMHKLIFK